MLRLGEKAEHDLDIARRRREPMIWVQYLLGVVGYFCANVAYVLTASFITLFAVRNSDGDFLKHPWPGLAIGLVVYAIAAVALFAVLTYGPGRRPMLEFGLDRWFSELGAGLLLGLALVSLSVGIVAALGGYRVSGVNIGPGILVGLGIGLGPGFAEEILFRGVLLRLLDKQLGSWAALAISAVLFGAVHISNAGAGLVGGVAIMVEAGLMLGAAYLLTRRLWFAVGIHTAWNAAQASVFSIDVSGTGLGKDGLLRSTMTGPDWLTGGSVGIEGSAISILVGLLAGLVLLWLAVRRGQMLPRVGRGAPDIAMLGRGNATSGARGGGPAPIR